MYKVVFFDFDDTLVRTMDFQFESYRSALKTAASFDLTKEVFDSYAGYNGKEVLKSLLKDEFLVESVYNVKHVIHRMRRDKPRPVRNVVKLLEMFTGKYTTALVSSTLNREGVEETIAELGIKFDYILTGKEYSGALKPDPGIYMKAMSDLDVKPEECIGFEDSLPGLAALNAAGIFAIDVRNFYSEGQYETFILQLFSLYTRARRFSAFHGNGNRLVLYRVLYGPTKAMERAQ